MTSKQSSLLLTLQIIVWDKRHETATKLCSRYLNLSKIFSNGYSQLFFFATGEKEIRCLAVTLISSSVNLALWIRGLETSVKEENKDWAFRVFIDCLDKIALSQKSLQEQMKKRGNEQGEMKEQLGQQWKDLEPVSKIR